MILSDMCILHFFSIICVPSPGHHVMRVSVRSHHRASAIVFKAAVRGASMVSAHETQTAEVFNSSPERFAQ